MDDYSHSDNTHRVATLYGMRIGVHEGKQVVFNAEARRSVTIYNLPLDTPLHVQMRAKNARHDRPWSKSVTCVINSRQPNVRSVNDPLR